MKKEKKQLVLPPNDVSLSIFVGIDGERYMNVGEEKSGPPVYKEDSSMPLWKRALLKLFLPPME